MVGFSLVSGGSGLRKVTPPRKFGAGYNRHSACRGGGRIKTELSDLERSFAWSGTHSQHLTAHARTVGMA